MTRFTQSALWLRSTFMTSLNTRMRRRQRAPGTTQPLSVLRSLLGVTTVTTNHAIDSDTARSPLRALYGARHRGGTMAMARDGDYEEFETFSDRAPADSLRSGLNSRGTVYVEPSALRPRWETTSSEFLATGKLPG